jgi:hypothetical protein
MYSLSMTNRRAERAMGALRAVIPAHVDWVDDVSGGVTINGTRALVVWVGNGTLPETQTVTKFGSAGVVFAARQFTPAARDALRAAKASWVDESGAAEISMGSVVVARDGRSAPAPKPKGWTTATLAVAEAILVRPGPVTASLIAEAAGLSVGAATKALRLLTDEHLLVASSARGPKSARRVADLDRLLIAYSDASIPLRKSLALTVGVLGRDLAGEVVEAGRMWDRVNTRWAATGVLAADLLAPHLTAFGSVVVYVTASTIAELERAATLAELTAAPGGRLTLAPFPTTATRTLATTTDGLKLAPWPRVYADLRTVGVRGEEAAEHLKEVVARGR